MIVSYSYFDAAAVRQRNPNAILLLQPTIAGANGSDVVHVTSPGGAVGWKGATDSLRGGKALGHIPAVDPAWDFLHNANGALVAANGSPTNGGPGAFLGWNLAAPSSKKVPAEVAKTFAYAAKLNGLYNCTAAVGAKPLPCWNGVHSDNWLYSAIGASWFYGSNVDANRDGKPDGARALRRNWANGLTRVGNLLRRYLPGKIVGGNGAWYQSDLYAGSERNGWLKASNYTLIEHMQKFSVPMLLSAEKRWLSFKDPLRSGRYMAVLQEATDRNGQVLLWTHGDVNTQAAMTRPDVLRSMRWGLTLSLMTGVYYEILGNWYGNPHSCRWWFDEFDGGVGVRRRGYLGRALRPYRLLAPGLYRRDFQHGIAINNSSSQTRTVALHGTFRRLKGTQDPSQNDGRTVTSVTVPPSDGIILLR